MYDSFALSLNVFIDSKSFVDDISISASVVIVSVYQYLKWNDGGLENIFSSESTVVVKVFEFAIDVFAPMVWLLILWGNRKIERLKNSMIRMIKKILDCILLPLFKWIPAFAGMTLKIKLKGCELADLH